MRRGSPKVDEKSTMLSKNKRFVGKEYEDKQRDKYKERWWRITYREMGKRHKERQRDGKYNKQTDRRKEKWWRIVYKEMRGRDTKRDRVMASTICKQTDKRRENCKQREEGKRDRELFGCRADNLTQRQV